MRMAVRIELSGHVGTFKDGSLTHDVLLTVWGNGSSIRLDIDDLSESRRHLVSTSDGPEMNPILDQISASARRPGTPPSPTPSAPSQ